MLEEAEMPKLIFDRQAEKLQKTVNKMINSVQNLKKKYNRLADIAERRMEEIKRLRRKIAQLEKEAGKRDTGQSRKLPGGCSDRNGKG